jgi:hypothetical protein
MFSHPTFAWNGRAFPISFHLLIAVDCASILIPQSIMLLITGFYRYTQCELMSVHYKHPLLLIEFEEHKSFSLEVSGVSTGKSVRQVTFPGTYTRGKILPEGKREVSVQGLR